MALFDQPKVRVDIAEMVSWGTPIDKAAVLDWVERILGADSEQYTRAAALL